MSDRTQMILAVLVLLAVGVAIQPVLVHWRHPQAVWMWCDMTHLCEPGRN
jgi:hypothetical protein